MRRLLVRRSLAASIATLAVLALGPVTANASATALLPLAPGQLTVLLGPSGEWQPQSGAPLSLTLLAGRPRAAHAGRLTAYVALQPAGQACAGSPAKDHEPLLDLGTLYASTNLVTRASPLTPAGGASPGVYAASVGDVVVSGSTAVRACTWLDTSATHRAAATTSQQIPLLNGLFAAAAWTTGAPASGISFAAESVGSGFSYAVSTSFCATTQAGPSGHVAAGQPFSYQVSISSIDCPTDGTTLNFGAGHSSLTYTLADAAKSTITHTGGCDFAGLTGLSLSDARGYVTAVGCRVGRALTAPFEAAVAKGTVSGAQVDGGLAPVAPTGTTVDLVIDG